MSIKAPAANFTIVPNELFELMPLMNKGELMVTLTIVRETLGWHIDRKRLTLDDLVEKTGLSRDTVIQGLKDGLSRDTLERTIISKNHIEWGIKFADSEMLKNEGNSDGRKILPSLVGKSYQAPQKTSAKTAASYLTLKKEINKDGVPASANPSEATNEPIRVEAGAEFTESKPKRRTPATAAPSGPPADNPANDIKMLEQAFVTFSRRPGPVRSNYAAYNKTWRTPLKEILDMCGGDVSQAIQVIEAAVKKLLVSKLTFDAPVQIIKTARSVYGDMNLPSETKSVLLTRPAKKEHPNAVSR